MKYTLSLRAIRHPRDFVRNYYMKQFLQTLILLSEFT